MEVLGGQRQVANGTRLDRLTGRCSAGFYRLHLSLDFDLFLDGYRPQFCLHARRFRDAHGDVCKFGFLKTRASDAQGICPNRQ